MKIICSRSHPVACNLASRLFLISPSTDKSGHVSCVFSLILYPKTNAMKSLKLLNIAFAILAKVVASGSIDEANSALLMECMAGRGIENVDAVKVALTKVCSSSLQLTVVFFFLLYFIFKGSFKTKRWD